MGSRQNAAKIERQPAEGFQKPTARIILRGARAAYVGPGLNLAPHRNAAATLVLGIDSPFRLAIADADKVLGPEKTAWTALIPSGTWHHLRATGPMAFLYLDPLSGDLNSLSTQSMVPLGRSRGALLLDPMKANPIDVIGRFFHLWTDEAASADPRILALVEALERQPDDFATLSHAAAHVGVSASRCQALLKAHLGMPFRRYRLWRRMAWALRALSGGSTLTQAAHAVGFNSSAHFSAAFKTMFGLAPSTLLALGVVLDLE